MLTILPILGIFKSGEGDGAANILRKQWLNICTTQMLFKGHQPMPSVNFDNTMFVG